MVVILGIGVSRRRRGRRRGRRRSRRRSTQRFQKPLNPFKEGYDKDN